MTTITGRHPRKMIRPSKKPRKPTKGQTVNGQYGRKPAVSLEDRKAALEAEYAQLAKEIEEINVELLKTAEIFEGPVNDLEAHEVVAALETRRVKTIGGYQNDFADLVDINPTTYNNYVNHSNNIKWRNIVSICEALDVQIFLRPKAQYADKEPV
jgi:DNA-binding XRE family transcriptional regulator